MRGPEVTDVGPLDEFADGSVHRDRVAEGCHGAYAVAAIRTRGEFYAQPGFVDVVYHIEEGEPYVLGQIIVRGNARTRDKVIRREALMAGLLPGEMLDFNRIEKFKIAGPFPPPAAATPAA